MQGPRSCSESIFQVQLLGTELHLYLGQVRLPGGIQQETVLAKCILSLPLSWGEDLEGQRLDAASLGTVPFQMLTSPEDGTCFAEKVKSRKLETQHFPK
jgi:hypothetical protein